MAVLKTLDELAARVQALGYDTYTKKLPKTITVVTSQPRVEVLEKIAKSLKSFGGSYNPKGAGSSIGRTELTGGYIVLAKSGGGGSGAGADVTKLTESAQCIYAAAHYSNFKMIPSEMKKAEGKADINESFANIYKKLPDEWIKSCMLGAEILKKNYPGTNYTFHRGSSWVEKLEDHWKALNSEAQLFSNLNKWSPADIWMVSSAGASIDLTKTKSIAELNAVLLKALNEKKIIGVSLKKIVGSASLSKVNVGADRPKWKFESTTTGLRDFWSSGDGYILFEGGKIQFRKFGSTWQGEIKGKNANMGKISGGPITGIMNTFGITLQPQREITGRSAQNIKDFYEWYSGISYHPKMSFNQFNIEASKKDHNWYVSKILTTQLLYHIENQNTKKQEEITSSFLNYASSQSVLSGPFVKVY